MLTFSIIVVLSKGVENRSRKGVFDRCLGSLLDQDFPKDSYEIVLVDSGSGLIEADWESFRKESAQARVSLRTAPTEGGNIGPARARNWGVRASRPDFKAVAFVDDDTVVGRVWLLRLSQALEDNPRAVGAGGACLPPRDVCFRNTFAAHDEYIYSRYFPDGQKDLVRLREGRLRRYFSRKVLEHPVFSGSLAYRKEIFQAVGGFAESFAAGVYGEDADLKERVLAKGGFLVFVSVVNDHLGLYNFGRFRAQQEGRGRGIVKFRRDHNLYPQTLPEIYFRLFLAPLTLPFYLIGTKFDFKISFLETLGYFFRQMGKLEYVVKIKDQRSKIKTEDNRRTKIVFLDHTPLIGGAQLALWRHLKHLDRNRFEPTVVVGEGGPMTERFKKIDDLKVFELDFPKLKSLSPWVPFSFLYATINFLYLAWRERPNLLVANTERAFYLSFFVSLVLRRRLILMVRDFEFSKLFLKALNFRVEKYLCVSEKIRNFYNLPQGKSSVVYVGSDLAERLSGVSAAEIKEIKDSLKIKPETLVIGFMGRLIEWKGPRLLLDVFAKIIKEESTLSIHLIIVGEGPMRGELEGAVTRGGLATKVSLVGSVADVEIWYEVFDVFVQASVGPEPFATTVIEAAMNRLPIVATKTGGTGEFIEHEKTGLLVDPTAEAMAGGLRRILGDTNLRKRLGEEAYDKASSEFTERQVTQKCERSYDPSFAKATEGHTSKR